MTLMEVLKQEGMEESTNEGEDRVAVAAAHLMTERTLMTDAVIVDGDGAVKGCGRVHIMMVAVASSGGGHHVQIMLLILLV